jgi:hypothetical protein
MHTLTASMLVKRERNVISNNFARDKPTRQSLANRHLIVPAFLFVSLKMESTAEAAK